MSHKKKAKNLEETVVAPNRLSAAVASTTNRPMHGHRGFRTPKGQSTVTWEQVNGISRETANSLGVYASSMQSSIDMVRAFGCSNMEEFDVFVAKTNDDLNRFTDEFLHIERKHLGKTGAPKNGSELAAMYSVVEEYVQYNAHFQGCMHHTANAFTDFALDANDRARAKKAAEDEAQAKDAVTATESDPVPPAV